MFYSDENKTMENVVEKLNELDIYPEENDKNLDDDNVIKKQNVNI